jgi:uncharacterized protein (TIGR02300 family)
MAELKLGTKFECYNCGTRFYDLGKPEPLCPKCGANQKDAERGESPSTSQAARRKRKVDIPKAIDTEEDVPIEDLPEEDLEDAGLDAALDTDAAEEEEDFDDDEV